MLRVKHIKCLKVDVPENIIVILQMEGHAAFKQLQTPILMPSIPT